MTEQKQSDRNQKVLSEIAVLVAARKYRSFTLRVEILKPNHFVTACISFDHRTVEESDQKILDYPHAILASFTCDVQMWLDFATRLADGRFEFAGIAVPTALSYSDTTDELYLGEQASRPRKCFLFSQTGNEQLYSSKPLVAVGLPPFANLADASARYVHEIPVAHNQTLYERTLVIALPQPSKIRLVEWLPGELRVRLIDNALKGHQLDIFYWQPTRVAEAQSIPKLSSEHNLAVPSGTTTIAGHLLAPDGVVVQSFVLHSPYSFIGEAKSALSIEQQVRADISAGESDIREMKTFFNPEENTVMRNRVLHSCIAFANTAGGHVYVGVEDNGELSGNGKLSKTMKKAKPPDSARTLSAALRKYVVENTRPVIEVAAAEVKIGSEWIVRLKVEPSLQMVTTHTNDVFIRAGASNRKPSADWLEARAARYGSRLPTGEPWN
jgi:hypothetical protein